MATPPDFTAGQVLTAAQINAVGLWLVKTQTIGNAVTSVTVNDAFSADYDTYLVTINGGVASAGVDIQLRIGNAAAGYYGTRIGTTYTSDTVIVSRDNNTAQFGFAATGSTNSLQMYAIIGSPFLPKITTLTAFVSLTATTGFGGTYNGILNNSNPYTSFELRSGATTLSGGVIRVYGYNAP
jgi:hypothetical protein